MMGLGRLLTLPAYIRLHLNLQIARNTLAYYDSECTVTFAGKARSISFECSPAMGLGSLQNLACKDYTRGKVSNHENNLSYYNLNVL